MLESLVDLTYRGIALGRAVKLTQVRPSGGFLELAAAMPVGSELTVVADGVTFGATVTWVHEQVSGSDRVPGMMIAPRLASDAASAWWQARVSIGDDQVAKPALPRNRPVTVRPRTQTRPTPPPDGALTGNTPAIMADLSARIAAAGANAGARKPTPPAVAAVPPVSIDGRGMSPAGSAAEGQRGVIDGRGMSPAGSAAEGQRGVIDGRGMSPAGSAAEGQRGLIDPPSAPRELVMEADEPEPVEPAPGMRRTGEHVVVDDGAPTTLMPAVDPSTLDIDPGSSGAMVAVADPAPEPAAKPDEPPPAGGGKRKKRRTR